MKLEVFPAMHVKDNIRKFEKVIRGTNTRLIAISKTKPNEMLLEAYEAGQRDFGENKVQELQRKFEELPKDIRWHMVGHLQRNKVKYIAPFVHLIHSVDSLRLLQAIDKEGKKANRVINVLLQVHIAQEESKFGFSKDDILELIASAALRELENVQVVGLMGMATNTSDESQVELEFRQLRTLLEKVNACEKLDKPLTELSMGMSGDHQIAIRNGSTMIRVGSDIFGARDYA